jgi:hypothetical protein
MKYRLFAVEVEACSNPLTYELEHRRDEHGQGSPLTWTSREGAEAYIDGLKREFGLQADPDIFKVVPLTGETDSENEESFDKLAAFWPPARSGDALN